MLRGRGYQDITRSHHRFDCIEFTLRTSPHCVLQVQLQGIFQSKHIDHFLLHVVELQKQLTVADSVLIVWMEVQRTWAHLESIFKGSDDICQQLPSDAHRFQAIDAEFQVCTNVPAKWKF